MYAIPISRASVIAPFNFMIRVFRPTKRLITRPYEYHLHRRASIIQRNSKNRNIYNFTPLLEHGHTETTRINQQMVKNVSSISSKIFLLFKRRINEPSIVRNKVLDFQAKFSGIAFISYIIIDRGSEKNLSFDK